MWTNTQRNCMVSKKHTHAWSHAHWCNFHSSYRNKLHNRCCVFMRAQSDEESKMALHPFATQRIKTQSINVNFVPTPQTSFNLHMIWVPRQDSNKRLLLATDRFIWTCENGKKKGLRRTYYLLATLAHACHDTCCLKLFFSYSLLHRNPKTRLCTENKLYLFLILLIIASFTVIQQMLCATLVQTIFYDCCIMQLFLMPLKCHVASKQTAKGRANSVSVWRQDQIRPVTLAVGIEALHQKLLAWSLASTKSSLP